MNDKLNNYLNIFGYYYLPKKIRKIDSQYWADGCKYYVRDSGYHWYDRKCKHFGYWVTCDEYDGYDKDFCVFIYKEDFVKDFRCY